MELNYKFDGFVATCLRDRPQSADLKMAFPLDDHQ